MTDQQVETTLIVSLGGSLEPVLKVLQDTQPRHVAFVVSSQTKPFVDKVLDSLHVKPLYVRMLETKNPDNLETTFQDLRRELPGVLEEWGLTWNENIVVDITGGTKVMTSCLLLATVLHASRYSYVSGQRTKHGVGVVETGTEQRVETRNPWQILAIEPWRQYKWAFNNLQFAAAEQAAQRAKKFVSQRLQNFYDVLEKMAQGYGAWERFDYSTARQKLHQTFKSLSLVTEKEFMSCIDRLQSNLQDLNRIIEEDRNEAPSRALLKDLLASARRRAKEGRYDDAVARLYRYVEGAAQCFLWENYQIRTDRVKLNDLPETDTFSAQRKRAKEGSIELGLRDAWKLLEARQHPQGKIIAPWLEDKQPLHNALRVRNMSLLAHGTRPVKEKDFTDLFQICLRILSLEEPALTVFPEFPMEDNYVGTE